MDFKNMDFKNHVTLISFLTYVNVKSRVLNGSSDWTRDHLRKAMDREYVAVSENSVICYVT